MDPSHLNVADAVIVLVIILSGVFAFVRGFVHELLAVVSWIGAAVATVIGFPYLQPETRKLIAIPLIADIATGVAIFLVVLVVLSVLTRILSDRVRNSGLGPLDRSLGLIFGFVRGAVVVCLAWLLLVWVLPPEDHPEWITEARSRPLVERGGLALSGLIPARLRGAVAGEATAPGTTSEAPAASEQRVQSLLPDPTADAAETPPAYNSRMRDDMQRAIEAVTQ